MIFETRALKKIVEEAEARKHTEIAIYSNGQILTRKTTDGYWEEFEKQVGLK